MKFKIFASAILFIGVAQSVVASAAKKPLNATLTLDLKSQQQKLTASELAHFPQARSLTVPSEPSYHSGPMTFTAVPMTTILKGVKADDSETLVFHCLDGFSASLEISRVLNADPNKAIAYLAIETKPWPPLKKGEPATAGPFYLIWEHPEKSDIKTEEWPYQVVGFELKPSLEKQYPQTVPSADASTEVRKGYRLFMQNCFVCHALNGDGSSQLGPDLNQPKSPTEYLTRDSLFTLIRNPQQLRKWPQSKMRGFSQAELSDDDVHDVIAYLEHKSKHR